MSKNEKVIVAPTLVSPKKAAEITGYPLHFIRQLFKEGRIVGVKIGTRALINVDKLIDYVNGNTLQIAKEDEPDDYDSSIRPIVM